MSYALRTNSSLVPAPHITVQDECDHHRSHLALRGLESEPLQPAASSPTTSIPGKARKNNERLVSYSAYFLG